jgi:hypothetical protein
MSVPTKSALSPARQRLIELMQQVNFGRIEALVVRGGEPVFDDPAPKIFREVKFGSENGPRAELESRNFMLKTQVVELLKELDQLGNGQIDVLTVRHGLPFGMHVESRC